MDVLNMLLLLLPGTPTVFQGDEIKMLNVAVSWEQTQDPFGLFWGKVLIMYIFSPAYKIEFLL